MEIRLEYVATMKVHGPASGSAMTVQDGDTIPDLLERLGIPERHRGVIVAFVNDAKTDRKYTLRDGDRVFLAMPVGGG